MHPRDKGQGTRDKGQGLALLTPREMDVLTLLARYKSNREIAAELVLAEATIKRHMESLLGKLGVHSRHQAAEIYLRAMADDATET